MPCCVFARANAHRRLASGAAVESFEELVAYLRERLGEGHGEAFLDYNGRNLVLFRGFELGDGDGDGDAGGRAGDARQQASAHVDAADDDDGEDGGGGGEGKGEEKGCGC